MSQLTLDGGEVYTRAEIRAQRAAAQVAAEAALEAAIPVYRAACERAAALAVAVIVIGPVGADTLDRQAESGRWPNDVWAAATLEPRRTLWAAAQAAGYGHHQIEDEDLTRRTGAALMWRLQDISPFYAWWFGTAYQMEADDRRLARVRGALWGAA